MNTYKLKIDIDLTAAYLQAKLEECVVHKELSALNEALIGVGSFDVLKDDAGWRGRRGAEVLLLVNPDNPVKSDHADNQDISLQDNHMNKRIII